MVAETAIVKAKRARVPPSHPPFVDMITEAIVALKERTGSSQYAITKYVEEKHAHLPQSFKKLLLLNLKKLVAAGKLVKVKASFKLPPRSSSAAGASAKAKKTETAKPKKTEATKAKKPAAAAKTTAAKAKTAVKAKAKTVAKPKAKAAAKASPAKKASVKKLKSVKKSPAKKKLAPTKKIVKKPKSVKSPAAKMITKIDLVFEGRFGI